MLAEWSATTTGAQAFTAPAWRPATCPGPGRRPEKHEIRLSVLSPRYVTEFGSMLEGGLLVRALRNNWGPSFQGPTKFDRTRLSHRVNGRPRRLNRQTISYFGSDIRGCMGELMLVTMLMRSA